jgi:hypothetical protein
VNFRLLEKFKDAFQGRVYNHRVSTIGDEVAYELYEDILDLDRSELLSRRIAAKTHVLNTSNRTFGKPSRRGDGTFGELVPTETPITVPGYRVARGPTATLEIGAECKIICVAQGRQVDRVISDLSEQVTSFRTSNRNAVTFALIGVNRAPCYRSIEGARKSQGEWRITRTTGKGSTKHPAQEADKTIAGLRTRIAGRFDEFLVFEFIATNEEPYEFSWVDEANVRRLYASAITRIAREYKQRFGD